MIALHFRQYLPMKPSSFQSSDVDSRASEEISCSGNIEKMLVTVTCLLVLSHTAHSKRFLYQTLVVNKDEYYKDPWLLCHNSVCSQYRE